MTESFGDVLIAGLSAVLGWWVATRSHQLSLDQFRLDASSVAADWLRDLRTWASEAIDVLAEAAYQSPRGDGELTVAQESALKQSRSRLSALTDRGRLLLPNERNDVHGTQKPPAYRGLRHAALDALVAAEKLLGGEIQLYEFPDRKAALIGLRREFVSMIQAMLDPKTTNREIVKLLRLSARERSDAQMADGPDLLPTPGVAPPGEDGLMRLASARFAADTENRKTGVFSLKR